MRSRFSIRDLLWLTTVVALAVALWLDHRQLSDANQRLSDAAAVVACTYVAQPNSTVAVRVLKTLKEAYSDVAGVTMTYDEAKAELQIAAPRGELAAIQAAMDEMEKASSAEVAAEQAANEAVTR
jgi:hypothetical protein